MYGCVVLDALSRRVLGWSIDASPTAALVTNAHLADQLGPDRRRRDAAGEFAPGDAATVGRAILHATAEFHHHSACGRVGRSGPPV